MKKLLVFILVFASIMSCSRRNQDINRVIEPYWDKSYFNSSWQKNTLSPDAWYYARTVIDAPPNTQAASIGDGHILHPETLRWEITKSYLVGWRTHGEVLGADGEMMPGAQDNFRGAAVAIFHIKEHFDIIRSSDPITSEISNEIIQNTAQQWQKRRFIRIDFRNNLVGVVTRKDSGEWAPTNLETATAHVVDSSNPAEPQRYRFEDNYFDFTTRQAITVDESGYKGAYGDAFKGDSAAPVIDTRHSFIKKSTQNDYQPLHYPNYLAVKNEEGKLLRDRKGAVMQLPVWDRFGFYRVGLSGRQTWEPHTGSKENSKNYNILRFNIWQKSKNPDGTVIEIEQRAPRPIIFYTNVSHPEQLMASSMKVAAQWDQAFRKAVFYAQPNSYSSLDKVPAMFILKPNSCEVDNVKAYLAGIDAELSTRVLKSSALKLEEIKKQIEATMSSQPLMSFTEQHAMEAKAKYELERICSSLEYFTSSSTTPFRYQRVGDLRYNMFNLATGRQLSSWSGLGGMLADSISGETIQATAHVNLWMIDQQAAQAVRQIEAINGKMNFENMVFGQESLSYLALQMLKTKEEARLAPSATAMSNIDRRISALGERYGLAGPMAEARPEAKISAILRSDVGQRLGNGSKNNTGSASGAEKDLEKFLEMRQLREVASQFEIDSPAFIESMVIGLALQYKDLESGDLFRKIRESVYRAVMLHEVGHTVGLTHNMAASSDALNYGELFWKGQSLPANILDAVGVVQDQGMRQALERCLNDREKLDKLGQASGIGYQVTTQDCLRQQEGMYSSVMDYHAQWNSDLNGLGLYDEAAIKFGYMQLVEVFPESSVVLTGNKDIPNWLAQKSWEKIPTQLIRGSEKISERNHIKYRWNGNFTVSKANPVEVPYRFCLDSTGTRGPWCRSFDFGPDMKTNAQWLKSQYWQHYFFTHFAQNSIRNAAEAENMARIDLKIMSDFSSMMKWYYYRKAFMPDFSGSDADKDHLSAIVMGLNHFAHTLGHPLPGEYSMAPNYSLEHAGLRAQNISPLGLSKILVPTHNLSICEQRRPEQQIVRVMLGDGRPLHSRTTDHYEDSYLSYIGSLGAKLNAGYYLAYPGAQFPRTDVLEDPGFYSANWYRLFPGQVGKLFYDLILGNFDELGPVVKSDGTLMHRNIINPVTLENPRYDGMTTIRPSISPGIRERSLFFAATLMSDYYDDSADLTKSLMVVEQGSDDDISTLDGLEQSKLATFVHPELGVVYRAAKIGEYPIAYELLNRLNLIKSDYLTLKKCAEDLGVAVLEPLCQCVETGSSQGDCGPVRLETVGQGDCTLAKIEKRKILAFEQLEDLFGLANDMRALNKKLRGEI